MIGVAVILLVSSVTDPAPAGGEVDFPAWVVPVALPVALAVIALIAGAVVALINRKPTQQAALLAAMQANREADSKENHRLDKKIDSLYTALAIEREYSMEWEDWHRAGMPDPPGRPRRPDLDHSNN